MLVEESCLAVANDGNAERSSDQPLRCCAVKKPPPCTAGSLFLAAKHSKFTSTPGSFEIFKNAKLEIMCKILTRSAERLLTLDAITRPHLANQKYRFLLSPVGLFIHLHCFRGNCWDLVILAKETACQQQCLFPELSRWLLKTIHTPCCEQFIVGICITV